MSKSPADILAKRSPAWRELLTGKPRIGTCDVCERRNVDLSLHVGFMGLQTFHCEGCSLAQREPDLATQRLKAEDA
jgi:hypothetical protein